jgi:hypothetical protein
VAVASRGSIISSFKAIPSGSRTNSMGQGMGASPYFGGYSPMVGQLDTGQAEGTWTNAYRMTLPRPADDFTNGAFGPFSPILPVPVDAPMEGSDFADLRRYEYQTGWNLPTGLPGSEGLKLASFATLKTLSRLYSVARACIELRKKEIIGLEWDIMPTPEAVKSMRGSHKAIRDFASRRAAAMKFFRNPDPDYFTWNTWLDAVLEEIFVTDALSVVIRRKWDKKNKSGLLGSNLDCLELVDGATIRPLRDLHGAAPRPPAPAYQQYLFGVPRSDIWKIINDQDVEEGGLAGSEYNNYRVNQLLYMPTVSMRDTPYGMPPVERALIPVMTGLQRQKFQNDFFGEGTVPAVYISPGGANNSMTPNQIRELQDALNAIAGDPAWKHKIIVLPADSKVQPQRPHPIADQFDEIIMSQVTMAFDVMPTEIGIVPKVTTAVSPGAARTLSKESQSVHDRKSTKAFLKFLSDIPNYILQILCGQDDMRFVFEGMESTEAEETKTKTLVTQVSAGIKSIDEAREALNLQPWGLHETAEPGWATPGAGFIPLTEATMARQTGYAEGPVFQAPAKQPTQQPATAASGQSASVPSIKPSPASVAAKPSAPKPSAPARPTAPRNKPPAAPTGRTVASGSKKPPSAASTTRKKPGQSQSIASNGSNVSAVGRKPSTKVALVLDSAASHARLQELEALTRMAARKGRSLRDWEPRHLDAETMVEIGFFESSGIPLADSVMLVKQRRTVSLGGQVRWIEGPVEQRYVPAGGGGPFQTPHDVNDIQFLPEDTGSSPRSRLHLAPEPVGNQSTRGPRGTNPGASRPFPRIPDTGQWPEGGIGTGQPPVAGVGNRVKKADTADEVYQQLLKNFPPEAIEWVREADWIGPVRVPLDDIDFDDKESWATAHQMDHVKEFEKKIEAGNPPDPGIGITRPGHRRIRLVDGHHRTTAYQQLGMPALLYVGAVKDDADMRWSETHSYQVHQGDDPSNKMFGGPAGMGPTVPKAAVLYRPSDDPHIRCGTCSMYIDPERCSLVVGRIKPDDVCNEWESRE